MPNDIMENIQYKIEDNAVRAYIDDRFIGEVTFYVENNNMVIDYTGIQKEFQGRNLGAVLVRRACDLARERGMHVVPLCSFARRILELHPEYKE